MDLLSVRRIRRIRAPCRGYGSEGNYALRLSTLGVSLTARRIRAGGRRCGSEGSYALSEKNLIVSLPARRLGDKVVWLSVRRINRISSSR